MDSNIVFLDSDTETAEGSPLLLEDKMKRNPEAYNFDDIPLPDAPTGAEMDAGMTTLEMAIGDYSEVKPGLYFKAPKLRQQIAIARAEKQLKKAEDSEELLLVMLPLGMQLFFVPDRDGFRPVTENELLDSMSAQEISAACAKFGGMSNTGEA